MCVLYGSTLEDVCESCETQWWCTYLRHYSSMFLKGLRKIVININQGSSEFNLQHSKRKKNCFSNQTATTSLAKFVFVRQLISSAYCLPVEGLFICAMLRIFTYLCDKQHFVVLNCSHHINYCIFQLQCYMCNTKKRKL